MFSTKDKALYTLTGKEREHVQMLMNSVVAAQGALVAVLNSIAATHDIAGFGEGIVALDPKKLCFVTLEANAQNGSKRE